MQQSEVGGVRVKKCKWKLGVVVDFKKYNHNFTIVCVKDAPASNDVSPLNDRY